MQKTEYHITQMDCPSEENLVRMKLEGNGGVRQLDFDIENRRLTVFHTGTHAEITQKLESLNLGTKLVKTEAIDYYEQNSESTRVQSRILWIVLVINFSFFVIEITSGFISGSMALVADSLDMLADASVYGLSLWAVGAAVTRKKQVARISGYFQMALAAFGLVEVIRRFAQAAEMPNYTIMMGISFLALAANAVCLYLLQKSKSREAHMKASMIFTSNDIAINFGVIVAGVLVLLTQSKYPDLIIGSIVFLIVVRGAFKILTRFW